MSLSEGKERGGVSPAQPYCLLTPPAIRSARFARSSFVICAAWRWRAVELLLPSPFLRIRRFSARALRESRVHFGGLFSRWAGTEAYRLVRRDVVNRADLT